MFFPTASEQGVLNIPPGLSSTGRCLDRGEPGAETPQGQLGSERQPRTHRLGCLRIDRAPKGVSEVPREPEAVRPTHQDIGKVGSRGGR